MSLPTAESEFHDGEQGLDFAHFWSSVSCLGLGTLEELNRYLSKAPMFAQGLEHINKQ